ncbi:UNKNOWN [Stylonychia lemnae]|uniref:Uncharacterized protein n=1 Tax=Stylonychia lemnae TaxID=5949 RepID=A0A078A9X3_STYLE|nr:UNKNOWN [Stylonychia lemnae]|eukprot:CDW77598.1 UNKNOWN [Stylonychia lemnae]
MRSLVVFHVYKQIQFPVKLELNVQAAQMAFFFFKVPPYIKTSISALLIARILTAPSQMDRHVAAIAKLAIKKMAVRYVQERINRKVGQQQSNLKMAIKCQTGIECNKCLKEDITKCSECNFPVNQKSILTGDFENPCTQQNDICLDAVTEQDCQACIYGYSLFTNADGNKQCHQCETDSSNSYGSTDSFPVRCNFSVDVLTGLPKIEQFTACSDGFFDYLENKCTTNCGIGRYGEVIFNERGMIETSVCSTCDDNCFECATQFQCISCKKGYYLKTETNQVTRGQCLKKSGTANMTIYVDSVSGMKSTDQTTGLSLNDPFYSIQSAITKAYEYGASYENAIVNIMLAPGKSHAMLRYNDIVILPRAYDQNSQSTMIKIDTIDGTQVKVLYKLRDKFNFLVGGGLEIRNVVFDATDSIIDSRFTNFNISLLSSNEYACLKDPLNNCCNISKDLTSGKYVITGPDFCQLQVQPNDQCHLPIGGSLIQFDITSQTSLTSPQTLLLQNVIFENFVYDFNALIELNDFGGQITLINTSFININSCGSVIRNKRIDQVLNYLKEGFLTQKLLKSFEILKSILPRNDLFSNICDQSSTSPCFSLNISGGIIQDFGQMTAFSQTPIWEQELDQYQNYGFKSAIQLRSLISIVNHGNYKIEIANNDFIQNSGTKGVIYLDMNHRSDQNTLIIEENRFQNNFGIIQSNVLFIRARGQQDQDVYYQALDSKQELCLGYAIKNNKFIKNFGFQGISGGSIHFECTNYQMQEYANGIIQLDSIEQTEEAISNSLSLENLELENYSLALEGNTYIDNTASKQNGIVNIINVKKLTMQNETFINNTDAFLQKSTILARKILQEYMPQDTNQEINILGIDTDQNLAASLIRLERSRYVLINSINFDSNYLIEPQASINRAQAIFLTDIVGIIQIDSINLRQMRGPIQYLQSEYIASNEIQNSNLLDGSLLNVLQTSINTYQIRNCSYNNWRIENIALRQNTYSDIESFIGIPIKFILEQLQQTFDFVKQF